MTLPRGQPHDDFVKRDIPQTSLRPLGALRSLLLFGAAAALLLLVTGPLHRLFQEATGAEPVIAWFILGSVGVFGPLLLIAVVLLRGERMGADVWRNRLRFKPLDRVDWLWTAMGLLVIAAGSALIQLLARLCGVALQLHPTFMVLAPLGPDRLWILALWLPFWLLNIFAEEILWRGVVLPRQEAAFGSMAWLANGSGWLLFHLAFGWGVMLVLLPTVLIIPYIVQKRRNSWIGIVLHAGLNGPAFLAVAFGMVGGP